MRAHRATASLYELTTRDESSHRSLHISIRPLARESKDEVIHTKVKRA